ncbi:hypothetical protein ACFO5R_02005 [Halosolutus amylolyticus]|uniref:Uncharacterized protein n=1 Tax=Halosolutus amylolyticus TaxID=2932267 RepID=A0ABD5PJV0_9EURY|nr:hypothetical protein [Halosolutus amylolyticus]
MSELPRRRLLALAGTATTAAIAGCTGSDDGDEGDEGNENDEDEENASDTEENSDVRVGGTVLGEIDIANFQDESHTVDIIVEFDGSFEEWKTTELEGRTDTRLERNWPTSPGSFRVIARLDGGEPEQVTPAKWNAPDCLNLVVMVRNGELSITGDPNGGPCGSGDAGLDDESDD